MVREKFNKLVLEEISLGWQRGIELFMEELNADMERDALINEHGLENVLEYLVMESELPKESKENK